jgi:hypothetical protein
MDYMDFRWSLLGVYKESTRSTRSLHGVHKDLWGSVKYSQVCGLVQTCRSLMHASSVHLSKCPS